MYIENHILADKRLHKRLLKYKLVKAFLKLIYRFMHETLFVRCVNKLGYNPYSLWTESVFPFSSLRFANDIMHLLW